MIAAVVIASGFSRRMGRSKLALEIGGRTFLQRAIDAASHAADIERCLVVVRPEDEGQVSDAVAGEASPPVNARSMPPGTTGSASGTASPVEIVLNAHAADGQSASIRLAVEQLSRDPDVEAAVFTVVDQPFLTPAVFEALIDAWRSNVSAICVSSYAGQRGNPALFPRAYFAELAAITGDIGGREVIRGHQDAVREVPIADPEAGRDVDTWEDYRAALERVGTDS